MKIKKLHVTQFAGLADFSIEFDDFTVLVGENASGKSSLLRAAAYVARCVEYASERGAEQQERGVEFQLEGSSGYEDLQLPDPSFLWHAGAEPGQLQLAVDYVGGAQALVTTPRSGYVICKPSPVQSPGAARALLLPPAPAGLPREALRPYLNWERELREGRGAPLWRNRLYWMHNDEKEQFTEVVKLVKRYVPAVQLDAPKLDHDTQQSILVPYRQHAASLDVGVSGGGVTTLLSLALACTRTGVDCLLLDEPDAHLHSSVQRDVARFLSELAADGEVQVIVATHSPDFIEEVPAESLRWIDRGTRSATAVDRVGHALVELGALTNAQALGALGAHTLLWVENDFDWRLLAIWARKIGLHEVLESERLRVVRHRPPEWDQFRAARRIILEGLNVDVHLVGIRDRDWAACDDADVAEVQVREDDALAGVSLATWACKEMESYLLAPAAMRRAIEARLDAKHAGGREVPEAPCEQEIRRRILAATEEPEVKRMVLGHFDARVRDAISPGIAKHQLKSQVEARFARRWADDAWRLRVVPGKEVLKRLCAEIKASEGVAISREDICRRMEQVPEDVERVLQLLQRVLSRADGSSGEAEVRMTQ